jgi:hypothetical protein
VKLVSHWNLPTIAGGDFNIGKEYASRFEKNGFKNISGYQNTYYNSEDEKYDWVIGKGISSSTVDVNPFNESNERWPNQFEGSDHTAIRLNISV